MDDKVMIVWWLRKDDDEIRIASFYTSQFAEWINFFCKCQKHRVAFYPNKFDRKIDDKIKESLQDFGACVEDFCIRFGSDESIQSIDVYLE